MTRTTLDAQASERVVALLWSLSRDVARTPTWSQASWETLIAALTEAPELVCPLLVLDGPPLLQGERLAPLAQVPAALKEALRRYEDDVLAPLLIDRRASLLRDAVVALPVAMRPQALGLTLAQALTRLTEAEPLALSVTVVRRLSTLEPAELQALADVALNSPDLVQRVARALVTAAQQARQVRALLTDAEVFLATHVRSLQTLAARVALRHLAEATQTFDEAVPQKLRLGAFDDGNVPTRLQAESSFPVGGFSSLTNHGSLENLVTSELMFIETSGEGPDLFDVRFTQNELLYYARDEAVAVRRQRVISVVFDDSLREARRVDEGAPHQRLVRGLAAVVVVMRRLLAAFSGEALRFEFVFVEKADDPHFVEERDVLQLMVNAEIQRGIVTFLQSATSAAAVTQARETHGQRSRHLVLAARMPERMTEANPDVVMLLERATPQVFTRRASAEPASDWPHAIQQVMQTVVRPQAAREPLAAAAAQR